MGGGLTLLYEVLSLTTTCTFLRLPQLFVMLKVLKLPSESPYVYQVCARRMTRAHVDRRHFLTFGYLIHVIKQVLLILLVALLLAGGASAR